MITNNAIPDLVSELKPLTKSGHHPSVKITFRNEQTEYLKYSEKLLRDFFWQIGYTAVLLYELLQTIPIETLLGMC